MWVALLQSALWCLLLFTVASALVLGVWHRPSFLADGPSSPRRVGLVLAHPDDESMFFVPTLAHLSSQGHTVALLCLSTGNADGLGRVREKELVEAAALLGIPQQRVHLIDDETHLADGMRTKWNVMQARQYIDAFIERENIDTIITFDEGGVSGHPNHVATFEAVRSLLRAPLPRSSSSSSPPLVAYALQSTPLWRKYAGLADLLMSWYTEWASSSVGSSSSGGDIPSTYLVSSFAPWMSYRAMAAHASQFVWYRRLFVVFSRYTFINTLQRIR